MSLKSKEGIRSMEASRPGGRYYRPELDVVRFLAFLLVFFCHALPHGGDLRVDGILKGYATAFYASAIACNFGLSLFFTLSAFLICELLLRERETAGTVRVKQFYIRRVLRIWPLYYLGLAIGAVVMFLPGGHPGEVIKLGWFAILVGAWSTAIHGWINNPVVPLWSISVEEQFYLFIPWILKYFNHKSLYGFCLMLIFVANFWLYYLGGALASENRIWANSFVQFECFAAGILLCLILHGQLPRIATWQRPALLLCAGCCWFFSIYSLHAVFGDTYGNPGSWSLIGGYALAALGSVFVLVAFLGINPKFLPGWAIYLGRISFGLYVYHDFSLYITRRIPIGAFLIKAVPIYPLRVCLNAGLTLGLPLALTFAAAALSYRYFETPFLKMKRRHSVIESQPIQGAG
jgi:peptidoglycan/LPS O-acetylase OafA/YrhL